jgi:hypothetical protein
VTNDGVHLVYDTISEDYTYPMILDTIAKGKPARVVVLHKPTQEAVEKRKDVEWLGECMRRLLALQVAEDPSAQ